MTEYMDFNPADRNPEHFEIPVGAISRFYRTLTVSGVTLRGLDLSHYQADAKIDFVALKANGFDFVILKVTEGTGYVDPTFVTKYKAALAAGLIVLVYHFFRSNYGGAAQAVFCIETLKSFGFFNAINYVPIIWADVESEDGITSVITRQNRLLAFLQTIESNGYQGGVYSSPYYWNMLVGNVSWISNYWQWAAHWTSANLPTLPLGWSREKCLFWQNGIYPTHSWIPEIIGVSTSVDHNYFLGTLNELKAILKWEEVPPPPSGDCNCEEEITFLTSEIARLEEEMNSNKLEIYKLQQSDLNIIALLNDLTDDVMANSTDIFKLDGRVLELEELRKRIKEEL